MVVWGSSSGTSPVLVVVYRLVAVGLGSAPAGTDGLGVWFEEESKGHISVLELKAILLALAAFLPKLSGQRVVLMSDNASVVTYLGRQGGTAS